MPAGEEIILVVEENEQNRSALAKHLTQEGFQVWQASSGGEALAKARENPTLIALDVQLPDMDGFELCRRLKSDPFTSRIPVLQTSATFVHSRDKVQGLRDGADAYLVQPVDSQEMVATIHALLRVRRAEAAAHVLAQQWQTTFDAINDGICLVNQDGRIERCNRAFARLVDLVPDQVAGRFFTDCFRGAGLDDHFCAEAIRIQQPSVREITLQHRRYRMAISPITGEGPTVSSVACVLSDITTIWNAEQTLRNLNGELDLRVKTRTAALEEANEQLESFCYSVSHDLRAPLRAMHAFSEILIEEQGAKLDAEGRDYLGRIHKASRRMEMLIEDLLAYSRVMKADIQLDRVCLARLVNEVIDHHKNDFAEIASEIRVDIPPNVFVEASSPMLAQVIWNLLSNAIKFVERGVTPRVRWYVERTPEKVRLCIADNGVGIAPEHQDRIFKMFEKLQVETAGTGIGLAIVRRAMSRMEGGVGFESAPGMGSTFWLELNPADKPKT